MLSPQIVSGARGGTTCGTERPSGASTCTGKRSAGERGPARGAVGSWPGHRTPRYWHGVAPSWALSARELGSLMPSFIPSSQPSDVPGIQLGNTGCICVECHETQTTQNSRISHSSITQKLPRNIWRASAPLSIFTEGPPVPLCATFRAGEQHPPCLCHGSSESPVSHQHVWFLLPNFPLFGEQVGRRDFEILLNSNQDSSCESCVDESCRTG